MYECGDADTNHTSEECDRKALYTCRPCNHAIICDTDGQKLNELTLQPGYWRSGPASETFESCLYPRACEGGNAKGSNASDSCSDDQTCYCHSGYAGPL